MEEILFLAGFVLGITIHYRAVHPECLSCDGTGKHRSDEFSRCWVCDGRGYDRTRTEWRWMP